jgi:hypothetical protein
MTWSNDRIRDLVIRPPGKSNKTREGMVSIALVMRTGPFPGLTAIRTAACPDDLRTEAIFDVEQ